MKYHVLCNKYLVIFNSIEKPYTSDEYPLNMSRNDPLYNNRRISINTLVHFEVHSKKDHCARDLQRITLRQL